MISNRTLRVVLTAFLAAAGAVQTQAGLPQWLHVTLGALLVAGAAVGIVPLHLDVEDERLDG